MSHTEAVFAKDSKKVKFKRITNDVTNDLSSVFKYADLACRNGHVIIIEDAITDKDKQEIDERINGQKLTVKQIEMERIQLSKSSELSENTYTFCEKYENGAKSAPQQPISEIRDKFENVWNRIPNKIQEQVTQLRNANHQEINAMDYLQLAQNTINTVNKHWCLKKEKHFTATNTNRNVHPRWKGKQDDNHVLKKLHNLVNCPGIYTWMLIAGGPLYPSRPHIENVNAGSVNLLVSGKKLWIFYDDIYKERIEKEVFPCIWREVC